MDVIRFRKFINKMYISILWTIVYILVNKQLSLVEYMGYGN